MPSGTMHKMPKARDGLDEPQEHQKSVKKLSGDEMVATEVAKFDSNLLINAKYVLRIIIRL
jgi:hypothetical protein